MLYEQEWNFFLKTLERFELQYFYLKKDIKEVDLGFRSLVGLRENLTEIYWEFFQYLKEGIIYHLTDHFFFTYLFLVLPEEWEQQYFLVGPYLSMRPSQKKIWEMAETYQIPITRVEKMEEFYTQVPTIPDDSLFYAMIYTLCEKLWEHELCVQKLDVNWEVSQHESYHPSQTAQNQGALLKAMEQIERRYELEEQMIHAVSLGDMTILDKFSNPRFIYRRLADPVRDWKNYCIILNTILRKAAQQGGVHPYDLDRVSSQFAEKIELLPTTDKANQLMKEMITFYCKLVQQCKVQRYSKVIQQAIIYIHHNLPYPLLTLDTVANELELNASYLSKRFKQETGKTITEYIMNLRMNLAVQMLSSTQLQIQTISQHCGILDVNYFTKAFKKAFHKTPSDYRKTMGI